MKFKNIKNGLLAGLSAAILSACSGGICTTNGNGGDLSLKITAPSQYPAGVPLTITLKLTNTSTVDGSNLVYTVPNDTNFTGVPITINPTGVSGYNCVNIPAGASCLLTATIPFNSGANPPVISHPGSFTVIATPNSVVNSSQQLISTNKLQDANRLSVSVDLGLVDTPSNGDTQFYILPPNQVVQPSEGTTTAFISIVNESVVPAFNTLTLTDENGTPLDPSSYTILGTLQTSLYGINSYQVTLPNNVSAQNIKVVSNTCNHNCSNNALINVASSNAGILSIQPNYFNMTPNYKTQVVTIANIGNGNVTNMSIPALPSQFTITENTCSSLTLLKPNQICYLTVNYTPNIYSNQAILVVSYNNSISTVDTSTTIVYTGTNPSPFAILTASPPSFSLSESNFIQSISVKNTGSATATNLALPNLTLALQESTTLTTCTSSQSLNVGESCVYSVYVDYTNEVSSGNESIAFGYNNGQQAATTYVGADWSSSTPSPTPSPSPIPEPKYVYVTNTGSSTISMYSINSGVLVPFIPESTVPTQNLAGSISFDKQGAHAYVSNGLSRTISMYNINNSGLLIPMTPESTVVANNSFFSGPVTFDPSGTYAYLTGSTNKYVSIYTNSLGVLAPRAPEPTVATQYAAPGIVFDRLGMHAYTINPGGNLVTMFNVVSGLLVPLSPESIVATQLNPNRIVFNKFGTNAYVVNQNSMTVSMYNVNLSGALVPLSPESTVPTGSTPFSLTLNSNGTYAYVVNLNSSTVSMYSISSGKLTPLIPPTVATESQPNQIIFHPSGKYAYVVNQASNSISMYSVIDGRLIPFVNKSSVATGNNPGGMIINPAGTNAYVANVSSNNITMYSIAPDGVLVPLSPESTVSAQTAPSGLTFAPF